jgi:very-short-patch-repair endonuclease
MKSRLKDLARRLRKSTTKHEAILWKRLRDRRFADFKFKRQQTLGAYIVDFICFERRLIIELDGFQHGFDENRRGDQRRDEWLRSQCFTVIRISNGELLRNMDGALQTIWGVLHGKAE